MVGLFLMIFVLPYLVGFAGLAFWRRWWMLGCATVVMAVLYFASLGSGDGPGAFAADAVPLLLGIGIVTGLAASVVTMTSNHRPEYVVGVTFLLGCLLAAWSIGFF